MDEVQEFIWVVKFTLIFTLIVLPFELRRVCKKSIR